MKDDNSNSTPASSSRPAGLKQRVSPPGSTAAAYRSRANALTKSGESMKSEISLSSSGRDVGVGTALLTSPPSSAVAKTKFREKSSTVGTERTVRRSLALKSGEEGDESGKFGRGGGSGNGRRRRTRDGSGVVEVEVNNRRLHELEEKLNASENVIKGLRLEVVNSRDELDEARALNAHLHLVNKGLSTDLDAAKSQVAALTENLLQVRKELTENSQLKVVKNRSSVDNGSKMAVEKQLGVPASPLAPPPPPLPPRFPVRRSASASTKQAPAILELYRSLSNPEAKKNSPTGNGSKGVITSVHNSIVGEIQNRSSHLMAVGGWLLSPDSFYVLFFRRLY